MNDETTAARLTTEIAKLVIEAMIAARIPWRRAFVRFGMNDERLLGSNGSFETSQGVFLLDPFKHADLFKRVNELGPELREATAHEGNKCCVFLLSVDSAFNFNIAYEHKDPQRWKISKLNGATGLPEGIV